MRRYSRIALSMWMILLTIGFLLEIFGLFTKCCSPKSAFEKDTIALEQLMANKRESIIEQSDYYRQIGIHGRAGLNETNLGARNILN